MVLVDDDRAVLGMVSDALSHHGMTVHAFSDGDCALKFLEDPSQPEVDLVISDINMEGMDGFDVIHRVKAINNTLPVVLMTGDATLDFAIRAMRMGAANLYQKPLTVREMVNSVFHLVGLHRELRLAEAGLRGLVRETRHFSFRSDELNIPSMVRHLTDRLVPFGFAQPSNVDVIAMAYHEALVNALEHGNLELDSSLKGDIFNPRDEFEALSRTRLSTDPWAARRVDVRMEVTPERYEVIVRDGGNGYDTRLVGQCVSDDLARRFGRGLAMIHMVMDEVTLNPAGNQITMVLKKKVR
ncbi:ATP-binding response regulator [Holophaga foetida]|uniref:ATP-binding response regulator n=1 Tax=Holophaga foetida TaxID=35839 RepID=UPI00047C94EE|nr:response regulator [Holophaga foetida]